MEGGRERMNWKLYVTRIFLENLISEPCQPFKVLERYWSNTVFCC